MQVLDLRSRAQFEAETIPGAIHYPADLILEEGLPSRTVPKVVLICEVGLISSMVAEALHTESAPVYYLLGGLAGL